MEKAFKVKRYNWCDHLIISLFSFLILLSTFSLSSFLINNVDLRNTLYTIENYLIAIIMFVTIIDHAFFKKRIPINSVLFIILAYFTMYINGDNCFFIVLIFSISLSSYYIDDVLKKVFPFLVVGLVSIIFLCMCGLSADCVVARKGGALRYALGFWHPNSAATFFMMIFLVKLYLNRFKLSLIEFVLMLFVTLLVFYMTDSRASLFLTMVTITVSGIYSLISEKFKIFNIIFNKKPVQILLISLPFIFCALTLLMTFMYSKEINFVYKIDRILSGRLYFSNLAFKEFEYSLFGDILVSDKTVILDNNYVFNIFKYGCVNSVVILALISFSIFNMIKQKNYCLIFIMIILLSFFMIEAMMLYYKMNILCIIFMYAFNSKNNDKRIKTNGKIINYNACL